MEKLSSLNSERKKARKSKKFCQKADRENGSQLMVSTRSFSGIWCYICCRCEIAAEFYKQEELRSTMERVSEKAEVMTGKTIGVVYVTFNTETTAKKFIEEYKSGASVSRRPGRTRFGKRSIGRTRSSTLKKLFSTPPWPSCSVALLNRRL